MKYWNELDSTGLFNRIFTEPISISVIDLISINLDLYKSIITIHFDLSDTSCDMFFKQLVRNNTCRCTVTCNQVASIIIGGIPTKNVANINIKNNEYNKLVSVDGGVFDINFACSDIKLMEPSLYTKH
ncbi:Imm50 family immunity protein [Aeromonas cavernicola]|uniref:Uncharacterized protein n=1 Tax=Aeromonas cavernicola TaxID=1006623 RepID=A0A2H9U4F0_9GAMM|nr:hypothetical protein CUC53_10065 [Aeromonas cavernicola]